MTGFAAAASALLNRSATAAAAVTGGGATSESAPLVGMLVLSNGIVGAALLLSLLVNVLLVCSSVCRPRAPSADRLQLLRGHAASDSLSMTRSSAAADEDGSL